jgi:serine protease Do
MDAKWRLVVAGLALILLLTPAMAGARDRPEVELSVVQLIAANEGRGGRLIPMWSGTGTIISPDGLILTNCHVAMPQAIWDDPQFSYDLLIVALAPGSTEPPQPTYVAEVAQYDARLDLAVVKVSQTLDGRQVEPGTLDLSALPLGKPERLKAGDAIQIFGYTGSAGETVVPVSGTVTALPRSQEQGWIETDIGVEGGYSGSPLVNKAGELVGVVGAGPVESAEAVAHCRYSDDTNADGLIDLNDSCTTTGGTLYTARPIDQAARLIRAAGYGVAPEPTATPKPRPRRQPSPTPQPRPRRQETPPVTAEPAFSPITFAEGVDREGNPVRPGTTFESGIRELYAFFDYQGMQDGWQFTTRWSLDGKVFMDRDHTWEGGESGENCSVNIHTKSGALPEGEYELELLVEGELVQRGTCKIGEGRPPAPTPTPKPAEGVIFYGRITDADTGRGIRRAVFMVLQPGILVRNVASEDDIYTMAETNSNGEYRLPKPLQRGETYSVIIGALGHRIVSQDGIYIPEDLESPHEVNVVLYRR